VLVENYTKFRVCGGGSNVQLFIHANKDTLMLEYDAFRLLKKYGQTLDISKLRNIAITLPPLSDPVNSLFDFLEASCPALKRLTIILGSAGEADRSIGVIHLLDVVELKDTNICPDIYQIIEGYLDQATQTRRHFEDYLKNYENSKLCQINLSMAFSTRKRQRDAWGKWHSSKILSKERIYLFPVIKQSFSVIYYTERSIPFTEEASFRFMCISDGAARVFTKENGLFPSHFDGIKELFEDSGNQRTNKSLRKRRR